MRSLEEGLRLPSDEVLIEIAERLGLDRKELIIAAYCDRSATLEETLRQCGIEIPEYEPIDAPKLEATPPPEPDSALPRLPKSDQREAAG